MEITELRVGNLVDFDRRIVCVEAIDPLHQHMDYIGSLTILSGEFREPTSKWFHRFKPAPLTDEWLGKFGFTGEAWKEIKIPVIMDGGQWSLSMSSAGGEYIVFLEITNEDFMPLQSLADIVNQLKKKGDPVDDDKFGYIPRKAKIMLRPIHFVHELQNLYFTLTGTELTPTV